MSLIAAPYVIAGTMSLFLGYKTYNSYYNQPFEYIEVEGFEEDKNIKTQDESNTPVKSAAEPQSVEEPKLVEEPKTVEEPQSVEEPKTVEEPQSVEEPKLVEEPQSVEEPKKPIKLVDEKLVLNPPEIKQIKIMETIYEDCVTQPIEKFQKNPRNNLRKRRKKNKKRR